MSSSTAARRSGRPSTTCSAPCRCSVVFATRNATSWSISPNATGRRQGAAARGVGREPTTTEHSSSSGCSPASSTASHPGAASSLREGMQETLTVTRLGVRGKLKRTLESTNPCESMIETVRRTSRNVKHWQSRRHVPPLDRCRDARSRTPVPQDHRLQRPRQARHRDRTRPRSPTRAHSHREQGEHAHPHHRVTITPRTATTNFHGERDNLPDDVGEAIAAYLRRGRPDTAQDRSVFVRLRAPHRALTPGAVAQIVLRACQRAGLAPVHAHRLRHTAACRCCGPARRSRKSGRCCATAALERPRSTPRSTARRWGESRVRGREGWHEHASPSTRGLPGAASRPGLQAQGSRTAARPVSWPISRPTARSASPSSTPLRGQRFPAGKQFSQYNRLLAVRGFARYLHTIDPMVEVPAADLLPERDRSRCPLPLYRPADRRADRGGGNASHAPSRGDLPDADRSAGGHRNASRRGDRSGPWLTSTGTRGVIVTVRGAKFGKTRELPLHPTTSRRYAAICGAATGRARRPAPTRCSSRWREPGCLICNVQSTFRDDARPRRDHGRARRMPPTAALTCATASRCAHCSTPTATGEDVQARMALLSTYLGHVEPGRDLLVSARPRRSCLALAGERLERHSRRRPMSTLAPTLQAFFTDRLIRQRNASPHTIAAYRDTIRLLLGFAAQRVGTEPSKLDLGQLDAPLIGRVPRPPRDASAGAAPAPATPVWRRSARSTATPRCATPSTPRRSNGSSRSHPSATNEPRHLPHRARARRAARRARPLDLDRPTRPRDDHARRPDRAARLRARSASPAATSTSAPARTSPPSARAASNGSRR